MQFDGISWPQLKGIQDGEYKLERTQKALDVLKNPHKKLKNIIHIAGTNGKGSTTAFLQNVLNANGFSVNVYTSPHLVKVNERIKIHSQNISDENLEKYTKEVYYSLQNAELEDSLTYFEAMTVVAFYAFEKIPADFNIIEVGLGGRFDATNVITRPLLSVITSISLDHMDYLGNTIEAIATEKCEIIKESSLAIMGFQNDKIAYNVFTKKCHSIGIEFEICEEVEKFGNTLDDTFQAQNATTTLKALEIISKKTNFHFERERAIETILNTKWKGRMETVFVNKINREIVVDCAHNLDGITKFVEFIAKQSGKKVLIFGMLSRKIRPEIFTILNECLESLTLNLIITVNFGEDGECFPSNDLRDAISHKHCVSMENFNDALAFTRNFDKIFLCGSIHLIGDFFAKYNLYDF